MAAVVLRLCFVVLVIGHLAAWSTVQGLLVHIVPHSHCDPGYRKTFDQYFQEDVNLTINTVLQALQNDQSKRFVWEEVSFLSVWWKQSSEEQHKLMSKLVQSKQLEFIELLLSTMGIFLCLHYATAASCELFHLAVNFDVLCEGGGWVMHDEAVTNAVPVMNQMMLGLDFLNETLGVRPQVGWHIDPFGHSAFTPYLYSAMEYKAFILNRIPDPIKQDFKQQKHLEFSWYPPYLDNPRPIFAHVLDSHYTTPFLFGLTIKEKAVSLVNTCKERAAWYLTPNLLIPFGGDYAFTDAAAKFKEMDQIMAYVNSHSDEFGLTMKYSTLSEYIDTVLQSGQKFPDYKGDFLPYVACYPCFSEPCNGFFGEISGIPCGLKDAFWTGFYTSKPAQKLLSYNLDEELRWAEILTAYSYVAPKPLSSTPASDWPEVLALGRNTSGLMQHHDAITGASFPRCYEDYNKRLDSAREGVRRLVPTLELAYLSSSSSQKWPLPMPSWEACSECVSKHQRASSLDEQSDLVFLVANPLPFNRTEIVYTDNPKGFCGKIWSTETGREVPSQVVGGRLYFVAETPALGVSAWRVMVSKDCTRAEEKTQSRAGGVSLTNGVIKVSFDGNGHVQGWTTADGGTHPFSHAYTQYFEKAGLEDLFTVCGGTNVYTFVPDEGSQTLTPKTIVTRVVAEGPLVWEVEQQINEYINHSIRLFAPVDTTRHDLLSQTVEWQTRIGPLPETRPFSVTSKFGTDILHEGQMTTYSHGYFPVKRVFNASAPFQGNVYPLVLKASINDTKKGMTVSTRRPVGVVGRNGSMEYLTHRRLPLVNDARGNDPSIMEDAVKIALFSQGAEENFTQQADMMSELFVHPLMVFPASLNKSVIPSWSEARNFELPKGLRVLSMQLRSPLGSATHNSTIGLRLLNSHLVPQSVDVAGLFSSAKVVTVSTTSPDFHITKSKSAKTTVTVPPLEVVSAVISLIH